MGSNIEFNLAFLNAMFNRYEVQLKFHRKKFDLNTVGFTLLGCESRAEIFETLGIKSPVRNALVTSYNVLNSFKKIKKLWSMLG